MHSQSRKLVMTHFLLHASAYSVCNFMKQLMEATCGIEVREYSLFQLLIFGKFLGVMVFSQIADRKKNHRFLIGINALISSLTLFFFIFAKFIPNAIIRKIFVIIIFTVYNTFLGGTFSLLDSLTYNNIIQIKKPLSYYGKVRLGGTFGNIFIHGLLSLILSCVENKYPRSESKKIRNYVNIGSGIIFGIIASFSCLFLPIYTTSDDINVKEENKENLHPESINSIKQDPDYKIEENTQLETQIYIKDAESEKKIVAKKDDSRDHKTGKKKKMGILQLFFTFKSICSPLLIAYSLALLFQGIDRVTLSTFLTSHLETRNLNRSFIHLMFLIRYLPEIITYSFSSKAEKTIGIDGMFLVASVLSIVRTFFFAFENFDYTKNNLAKAALVILEVCKGFYSSFLNYSCLRIFKLLATENTSSFGQGLYTAIYNALSYTFCAPLGYFIFNNDKTITIVEKCKKLFFIVGIASVLSAIVPIYAMFNKNWRKQQRISM